MLDVIIRGGTVVDGTGAAPTRADVGITSGRISAIGLLPAALATEVIDASGRVVAPGLVDVHSHSDLVAFLAPEPIQLASVRQGVTTEVTGNCGWTPYPAPPDGLHDPFRRHLSSVFGPATRIFDSLADYRREMDGRDLPVNLAPLVGHGSIRAAVLGLGSARATDESDRRMATSLDRALSEGAFGMSSGLVYPPGVYSTPEEITALAAVVGRRGRLYTTHIRDEMELVLDAVDEGIEVARRTGTRVQLSHVKVAGREQWGTMPAVLTRIGDARAEGLDVRGDAYPYTAGSTLLRALLPPWVNDGGVEAALERLRDPGTRRRIGREFRDGIPGWQNLAAAAGWEGLVVAAAAGAPETEGRTVAELVAASHASPVEVITELLIRTGGDVVVILHMMAEHDVADALASADVLIGSDTIPLPGAPHPRSSGTFARMLRRAANSADQRALPAAVRRLTSEPAERFGLAQRGRIARGAIADIVVFDPVRVADGATYDRPLARPTGIYHVLVAGQLVIRDGEDTGRRPGRVLEPAP